MSTVELITTNNNEQYGEKDCFSEERSSSLSVFDAEIDYQQRRHSLLSPIDLTNININEIQCFGVNHKQAKKIYLSGRKNSLLSNNLVKLDQIQIQIKFLLIKAIQLLKILKKVVPIKKQRFDRYCNRII
eukprot:UN24633